MRAQLTRVSTVFVGNETLPPPCPPKIEEEWCDQPGVIGLTENIYMTYAGTILDVWGKSPAFSVAIACKESNECEMLKNVLICCSRVWAAL